jgi:hypothetical protein
MKKGHIFIQCASYRDPELKNTIKSALNKAQKPNRVSFGICLQGELDEMDRDLYKNGLTQCRTVFIHKDASHGIGYARQKAQMMYEGEEFVLQIDSHMRFAAGWDRTCINQLEKCPSRKPVLTAYLSDYHTREDLGAWRLGADGFDEHGQPVVTGMSLVKANKPQLAILGSGHFVFSPASFFEEVPVDPEMQFLFEETLLAPRGYTNGWDLYHPNKAALWHKWDRSGRILNWDDKDVSPNELRCATLFKQLMGIEPGYFNFGKYGMGTVRTLAQYEQFSGIDFKNQILSKRARKGLPALGE